MNTFDCVDYVICHKPYPVRQDEMYRALCVGGMRADGALCELDGENIAGYNERINELTGLYWIWKNTESEYVGMSHYRRFFYDIRTIHDRPQRLGREFAGKILTAAGYDMILSRPFYFPYTIYDNLRNQVGVMLSQRAKRIFAKHIREKQPEYAEDFEAVLKGNRLNVCHMFVTRREILDRYCAWLFSFLLEAADELDVDRCDVRQRRAAGFFAENLLTVWMRRQDYKAFELPVMVQREDGIWQIM